MSNNVIEQAIRPEVPDVIPNEFFYIYVPKATATQPGIAAFDADDFNLTNGKVTINTTKWGDKTYIDGKFVASANRIVRDSTDYAVTVDTTLKTVNIISTDSETLEDGTIRSVPTTYNIPFKAGQGTTFVLSDNIIAIKSDVGRLGSVNTAEIFNDYAGNVATGDYSHAEGEGTIASGQAQHVFGKYNVSDESNTEIVGGGTDDDNRKNIRTLSSSGNQWIAGKHSQEGTPTNDKDLTTKLYVDTIASSLNDDITSLQAIVGTGENYIGQLSGDTLPSSSDLDDYVQEQEGRAPKGGDTIMFVLYVTGGEDEIYKYMYNGTTWASFMIPAVEVSANGELGVVKGTYGIGSTNDILVDIVDGEIKNIYAKDKDSDYVKMGLPASITETVTSVAAGTTGYDITCEVTEERVDNTSFSYDQVRNLPIVGGTGIRISVEDSLVKIDAEVTKSYVDSRITDSNIRINNLERSVYGELSVWSDETFLALKNAILPSTITVDSSTYNVIDGANGILSSVKGNTKQFNQLVQNGNFANGQANWSAHSGATLSVSNNVATVDFNQQFAFIRQDYNRKFIVGHKYYKSCFVKRISGSGRFSFGLGSLSSVFSNYLSITPTDTETKYEQVLTYIASGDNNRIFFSYLNSDDTLKIELRNVQIVDLTAIGLESITTAEEFTALYSKSYYEYNAGTLYDSVISGVSFTGKNLWDEQWEGGGYNTNTGDKIPNANTIRSKNYIAVLPNSWLYVKAKNLSSTKKIWILYYDSEKNFIGQSAGRESNFGVQLPASAYFVTMMENGTSYDNSIMISHINVAYEPYVLSSITLPSSQTLGGVGTAQDEIQVTKNTDDDYYTIKKIQRVASATVDGVNVKAVSKSSSANNNYLFSLNVNSPYYGSNKKGNIIADKIITSMWYKLYGGNSQAICTNDDKKIWLSLASSTNANTIELANEWLRNNNFTLTYERIKPVETTITTTATLAEVSAIRTNGGMISVVGNTNEDYAQPDVSETILHSVTPNA